MSARVSSGMAPTKIDVPHQLGREAAKVRIGSRIGELANYLPAFAEVRSHWTGEYRMELDVAALGQDVAATLDIEERVVRVTLTLPPMLAMMSGVIEAAVRTTGGQLLLGDETQGDDQSR